MIISELCSKCHCSSPKGAKRCTACGAEIVVPNGVMTNAIGMDFVLIPLGAYVMGNNESDEGDFAGFDEDEIEKSKKKGVEPEKPDSPWEALGDWVEDDDEYPVTVVEVSKGFYLGRTQVTQGQWKALMGYNNSVFSGNDNLPVENVSWHEAQEFILKLNQYEPGFSFRLPSEAEWEYSCRAGSVWSFSVPNFWHEENSHGITHPVGHHSPNGFGMFDMHGNVWEWCEDWYDANFLRNLRHTKNSNSEATYGPGQKIAVDPMGPSTGEFKVMRGGSWDARRVDCRSSIREKRTPDARLQDLGFRVVATLVP